MIIKILGGWDYTPKFSGNTKMIVSFNRLSGRQELELNRASEDEEDIVVSRFLASIDKIKNPLQLQDKDGKLRDMVAADIVDIPELKDLYYELVIHYSEQTAVTEDSVKKQG